jgi:nitrate/nitrite transporter NarK
MSQKTMLVIIAVLLGVVAGLLTGVLTNNAGSNIVTAIQSGGAAFVAVVTLVLLIAAY